MKTEYVVPSYYKDFKCKGGDCRTCCCSGWTVTVSMKEYFDLLSLPCTPALRYKIDGALHLLKDADEERYAQIVHSYTGECPMQREDGLCALHAECGEENLPSVCRYYPRSPRLYPRPECCVSCSCEKVLEQLIASPERLSFEKAELDFTMQWQKTETPENYDLYRKECLETLSDRSEKLRRRLDKIFLSLNDGVSFSGKEDEIVAALLTFYSDSPSIGEECQRALRADKKTIRCVDVVTGKYPSVEIWAEKILANHFFYEKIPFPERGESFSDVGNGIVGLCLLWLTLLADDKVRSTDDFVDITGKLFRVAEHTRFYKNAAIIVKNVGSEGL